MRMNSLTRRRFLAASLPLFAAGLYPTLHASPPPPPPKAIVVNVSDLRLRRGYKVRVQISYAGKSIYDRIQSDTQNTLGRYDTPAEFHPGGTLVYTVTLWDDKTGEQLGQPEVQSFPTGFDGRVWGLRRNDPRKGGYDWVYDTGGHQIDWGSHFAIYIKP